MAMSRFSCDVCGSRYQTLKQLLAHRDCPRCNGRVTLDPGDFHVPVCISCGWRDYPETEDWQREEYRGTKHGTLSRTGTCGDGATRSTSGSTGSRSACRVEGTLLVLEVPWLSQGTPPVCSRRLEVQGPSAVMPMAAPSCCPEERVPPRVPVPPLHTYTHTYRRARAH